MKKLVLLITVLFACTGFYSCKKFLDTQPKSFISPSSFYTTNDQLNAALESVYQPMLNGTFYGQEMFYDYSNGTDENFLNVPTASTAIALNNHSAQDGNINGFWGALYQGIDRANSLLENTSNPSALVSLGIDTAKAREINGEALFMRSYYYFMLVSYFGDVPLKLHSTTDVLNVNVARSPSAMVYTQLTSDMIKAEAMINPITAYTYSGHITQSAADGILARVFLYWAGYPLLNKAKYTDALFWANKARSNPAHSLNPSYRQIFINYAKDLYDTKESMWEVEAFWAGASATNNKTMNIGTLNGINCAVVDTGFSAGFVNGTAALFNSYTTLYNAPLNPAAFSAGNTLLTAFDNRRDWVMANYRLTGANTPASPLRQSIATSTAIYDRNTAKWRREYEPYIPKDKNVNGENWPLLRYSDVLLMSAEADNELNGPTTAAINAVNLVRERSWKGIKTITVKSGGSGYTSPPKVTISGGGGSLATASAVITAGVVTAINVTYSGIEYTFAPNIVIDPPTAGTTATATATILTAADADLTVAQSGSQAALRQVIQDERMRELCYEGYRRMDLIRWGIYVSTLKANSLIIRTTAPSNYQFAALAGENVSQRNVLFPIPQSEISTNKLATQNPGF